MCSICDRSDRALIEHDIVNMTSPTTVEDVAQKYICDPIELMTHALFHVEGEQEDSLVRRMKLKEVSRLDAVSTEYFNTLKVTGRRIRGLVQGSSGIDEDDSYRAAKLLTKPMVDLYVGIGSEIRQTTKALAELEQLLNGPKDSTVTGLQALADAIRGSDNS